MVPGRIVRWSLCVGFALGVLTIPLAYAFAPAPRADAAPGVGVTLRAQPSGELALRPAALLSRPALLPGRSATGSTSVRNLTGTTRVLALRITPDTPALDRALRLRVTVGGRAVYAGDLAGLRELAGPFRLRPGQERRLAVQATVAAQPGDALVGQAAALRLEFAPLPLLGAVPDRRGRARALPPLSTGRADA